MADDYTPGLRGGYIWSLRVRSFFNAFLIALARPAGRFLACVHREHDKIYDA